MAEKNAQDPRVKPLRSLLSCLRLLKCSQGGASIQHRPQGWSLLHVSAVMGQASALKWLLSHKLSVKGDAPLGCIWVQACLVHRCHDSVDICKEDWNALHWRHGSSW